MWFGIESTSQPNRRRMRGILQLNGGTIVPALLGSLWKTPRILSILSSGNPLSLSFVLKTGFANLLWLWSM